MKAVSDIFQSRGINYGWVMVLVVFTLSGLAFGTMASISVFLKPVSLEFGGPEVKHHSLIQLLLLHPRHLVSYGDISLINMEQSGLA